MIDATFGPSVDEARLKRALDDLAFWFLDGFFAEPLHRLISVVRRMVAKTGRRFEQTGPPSTPEQHAMNRILKTAFAGKKGWIGRVYAEFLRVCGVEAEGDDPSLWTSEQRTKLSSFTTDFATRLEVELGFIRRNSLLFRLRKDDGGLVTEKDLQFLPIAVVEKIQKESAEELGRELGFRWAKESPRIVEELLFVRFAELPFGAHIRAPDIYNVLGKKRQFMTAHENARNLPVERHDSNKLVIVGTDGPRDVKLYSRESVLRWLVHYSKLLQLKAKLDDLCRPPTSPNGDATAPEALPPSAIPTLDDRNSKTPPIDRQKD